MVTCGLASPPATASATYIPMSLNSQVPNSLYLSGCAFIFSVVIPSHFFQPEIVFEEQNGELAAVGTFTPRWVDKLNKNREFTANENKGMKRLMTTIAQGARAVMRVYTRACQDKNRDKDKDKINRAVEKIAELRQVGMLSFLGPKEAEGTQGKPKKGKKKPSAKTGCFPPREVRNRIEQGAVILLHWEG